MKSKDYCVAYRVDSNSFSVFKKEHEHKNNNLKSTDKEEPEPGLPVTTTIGIYIDQ